MPSSDPFSGLRLSEQAAPSKIEQRLFTSEPSPAPTGPKGKVAPKIEDTKATSEPKPSASKPVSAPARKPQTKGASRFDLDNEPLYKASYLFTLEELEALEDLKLELRREYDTKVTKNNLIRSALHMLLEDHAASGERSYASRKVLKR